MTGQYRWELHLESIHLNDPVWLLVLVGIVAFGLLCWDKGGVREFPVSRIQNRASRGQRPFPAFWRNVSLIVLATCVAYALFMAYESPYWPR